MNELLFTDNVWRNILPWIQRTAAIRERKYKSLITFQYGQGSANAKSVLSVLGACVKCGDEITIFCEGEDETEALRNLVTVINNGLGE